MCLCGPNREGNTVRYLSGQETRGRRERVGLSTETTRENAAVRAATCRLTFNFLVLTGAQIKILKVNLKTTLANNVHNYKVKHQD